MTVGPSGHYLSLKFIYIYIYYTRGNRTPGSRCSPGRVCLAVAKQFVPINAHATWLSRSRARARAMATKRKTRHNYSTHNLASMVSFGMQASVNDSYHGHVVTIFVCLSEERYCHRKSKRALEQWRPTARQKRSYLHDQGEFQHQLLSFRSGLDSDHGGVVRIFAGQSQVVKHYIYYIIYLRGTIFRLPGV